MNVGRARKVMLAMDDAHSLVQAAFDGDVGAARRLLDAGVSVESADGNWNALHTAIENQRFDCVRLLVERGANIENDDCGMSPLAHAIDIACDGSSQLGIAPEDVPTEVVDYLLAAGANPETGLRTAQAYANATFLRLLRRERAS